MAFSALSGVQAPTVVAETPKPDQVSLVREIPKKEVEHRMSTEEYVKQYFSDAPIMIRIAQCESHFRQLDSYGNVRRGVVNNQDVGVMQINEFYHLDEAQKANYNIYTLEGNIAFARKIYEKEGTTPWNSSRPCWGKYEGVQSLALNLK